MEKHHRRRLRVRRVVDATGDEQRTGRPGDSEVDDAPVVKFLHKMLLDAFTRALPTCTSSRTSTTTACASDRRRTARDRLAPIAIKEKLASRDQGDLADGHSEKRDARRTAHEAQDRPERA
jgi:hypothetical protein